MPAVPGVPAVSIPVQGSAIDLDELEQGNIRVGNVQIQTDENGGTDIQVGDDVRIQTDKQVVRMYGQEMWR